MGTAELSAIEVSCQPYGYPPDNITFSYVPRPTTSAGAEATALALSHACDRSSGTTSNVRPTTTNATGVPGGPNAGQAVWHVDVVFYFVPPSASTGLDEHIVVEVNQATGVPTVIAYG